MLVEKPGGQLVVAEPRSDAINVFKRLYEALVKEINKNASQRLGISVSGHHHHPPTRKPE
jgi:hypothetical protein